MKKNQKDKTIKKMAKEVKAPKPKNFAFDNRLTKVERDWTLGVVFGFLILIIGVYYSAYFYNKYRETDTQEQVKDLEVSYNEKLVESAIEELKIREERYQSIIKGSVDGSKNTQSTFLNNKNNEDGMKNNLKEESEFEIKKDSNDNGEGGGGITLENEKDTVISSEEESLIPELGF